MKALIHADSYDYHEYRPDSYILYDHCIREVGPMSAFPGADQVIDCRNALVMPGLIVGHAHLYSALVRGLRLPFNPSGFRELLEQLWWRFDRGIDGEIAYHSARVFGLEHLKAGVTTIIDHHAGGAAIGGSLDQLKRGLCDELGLRGIFCFETSDRFGADACIAENLEFARKERSDRCAGMFGMHASMSLSEATLAKIAAVLGDLPVHVHVAESAEDEADSLSRYGKRVVRRLHDHGLLSPNSLLAHCVHIDEAEAALIAEDRCVVALNPTSNMNNAVGLPDLPLLQQYEIPVIIGTDSLGANLTRDYLNLLFGMHLKTGSTWRFSYDDLLRCIRQVYEYAGTLLGIKLGRIEPGYAADLLAVSYQAPTPLNAENIFGHMVTGVFDRFQPREVWCRGELKLQNYETVWDEAALYAEARQAAVKLWGRI